MVSRTSPAEGQGEPPDDMLLVFAGMQVQVALGEMRQAVKEGYSLERYAFQLAMDAVEDEKHMTGTLILGLLLECAEGGAK